jgi:hypothetical protein
MILVDVNVLIHAYDSESPVHDTVRDWWERTLRGPCPVALSWVTILGFIRIMTNRRIMQAPIGVAEATADARSWLEHPRVQLLEPGERHAETLFALLEELGTAGNLTTDAHLAALAIEYQAEIASTDTDFARFPGLRWFNPLALRR